MADDLYPTPTRLALLADIAAGKVADDADGAPHLDLGEDGIARVAEAVWTLYRAGWCHQAPGSDRWELTQRGTAVLQGRR